jgi:hypothetical protein
MRGRSVPFSTPLYITSVCCETTPRQMAIVLRRWRRITEPSLWRTLLLYSQDRCFGLKSLRYANSMFEYHKTLIREDTSVLPYREIF